MLRYHYSHIFLLAHPPWLQEWVQCLTVAVAHSQAKDSTLRRLAYGGSLGRLTAGHGRATPHHYHASLNSNLALRTAV